MANKSKWRTISLPDALLGTVESLIKDVPEYTSMSDFVAKATADKLKLERSKNPLSDEDKTFLLVDAEDYYKLHHNFEEEGVRDFLKTQHLDRKKWPLWKIELGVLFICSLKTN